MDDATIRTTLARHGKALPDEGLVLADLRWAARDDDWYVETVEGVVYWLDVRVGAWVLCCWGAYDSKGTGLR